MYNPHMRFFIALLSAFALLMGSAHAQTLIQPTMVVGVHETLVRSAPDERAMPLGYLRCGSPVRVLGLHGPWVKIAIMPGQPVKAVRRDGPYIIRFQRPIVGYVKRIMLTNEALCPSYGAPNIQHGIAMSGTIRKQ